MHDAQDVIHTRRVKVNNGAHFPFPSRNHEFKFKSLTDKLRDALAIVVEERCTCGDLTQLKKKEKVFMCRLR